MTTLAVRLNRPCSQNLRLSHQPTAGCSLARSGSLGGGTNLSTISLNLRMFSCMTLPKLMSTTLTVTFASEYTLTGRILDSTTVPKRFGEGNENEDISMWLYRGGWRPAVEVDRATKYTNPDRERSDTWASGVVTLSGCMQTVIDLHFTFM